MSLAEELEAEGEQLGQAEIWGERAQQLVDYVKQQTPPVAKKSSICVFAMRKGWETPTREGIIKYCLDQKLLVAYQSINGLAFKIPLTRVFDQAEPGAAPVVEEEPQRAAAPPPAAPDACLYARTAPKKNFGCPVHGGSRISKPTKEKTTMAKEWITCAAAGELLGISAERVGVLARAGKLESKKDDSYTGKGHKPLLVNRASVIARRDAEKQKGDILDEPKAKPAKKPSALAKAPKPEKSAMQTMRRASKPARVDVVAKLADEIGALREDVIMLVRLVDRGWMSQDQAFGKLREIAGSL